jgi:hypothetical protein
VKEGLILRGADALHIATALEVKAREMITSDGRLNKEKMARAVSHFGAKSNGLRIITGSSTACLPSQYLQSGFLDG